MNKNRFELLRIYCEKMLSPSRITRLLEEGLISLEDDSFDNL